MNRITKSFDETVLRNEIRRIKGYIEDYDLIKAKKHPSINNISSFYSVIGMCRQNFLKVYHRYKNGGYEESLLLPQKRGPKYKTRRVDLAIELAVTEERKKGCNRYEIFDILKKRFSGLTPSPSCIYKILKRYGMNKLSVKMKEEKKKIIREKIGSLGHTDCHDLPNGIAEDYPKKLHLVGLIDTCSRIGWCEVIKNKKSLTVMFGLMRCFTALQVRYSIEFEELLNDNGPEFGLKTKKDGETDNPVQILLQEIGIKQRFTRANRPQTNGKMERFWRTIHEDFIEGTTFDTFEELQKELTQYMIYYNEHRPHQGINGKKPIEIVKEQIEDRKNV